jgi:hypothetical protein
MDPHEHDNAWKSRSRPGGAESRFNSQSLVNKWHVADPKIIFAENPKLILLELKGKPTSIPAKSAGACAKSRK